MDTCNRVIEVARHAGVCYGVERALHLAHKTALKADQPVKTLGPLIHNPRVVKDLRLAGVSETSEIPTALEGGTLVIRAHGVRPDTIKIAEDRGIDLVDATCPYVSKVHRAARKLVDEGYQVLVVGEPGHPEVEGILGHAGSHAHVIADVKDLDDLRLSNRIGIVVQTTQTEDLLAAVTAQIIGQVEELKVINTICRATQDRQASALELAKRSDVMIVIGGRNSGNTRRLAELCSSRCEKTYHIEEAHEILPSWVEHATHIGISAGASTPASHIEEVLAYLLELLPSAQCVWERGHGQGRS
ncbi:4-hydroxy-3-methylbut-2-enyl diphosphate reductase [Collinsella sp. AGMB00827]|uniref:4-hydroxy-3-methylbut-2-enyl diphosphate reductase n=1 Tax=Collinsella ureilytica TaxID=2869515 RepID=A0ABS7MKW6_9ACTN|nr:4-hydroxy-3-methylbut-2-enyl diphosphate reductase [Collinsella urealyticum]